MRAENQDNEKKQEHRGIHDCGHFPRNLYVFRTDDGQNAKMNALSSTQHKLQSENKD